MFCKWIGCRVGSCSIADVDICCVCVNGLAAIFAVFVRVNGLTAIFVLFDRVNGLSAVIV